MSLVSKCAKLFIERQMDVMLPCFVVAHTWMKKSRHCTVVNKGVIIEILDFELGAFSENLRHITTWSKGIFGFYLQKKKF